MSTRRITVTAIALAAMACSQPTSAPSPAGSSGIASTASSKGGGGGQGGSGATSAVMQFGKVDVGSQTPPGSTHDASAHAKDDIVPRTVVIDEGGTVTFNLPPNVHQIAIYKPGVDPEDINTSIVTTLAASAGCAGNPIVNAPLVINDPANREAVIPVPCFSPQKKSYTFANDGKYLVICSFLPHFNVGMYAWVDVKNTD